MTSKNLKVLTVRSSRFILSIVPVSRAAHLKSDKDDLTMNAMDMESNTDPSAINVSNITGWDNSKPKICSQYLENPRNTLQAVVLILYNRRQNCCQKFRSTIVKNIGVMKAYGKGEFVGQAVEDSIQTLEGQWCRDMSFGLLSFDTVTDAEKFLYTDTEIRNWLWMGGVEVYLIPACNPCRTFTNCRYLCLDLVDIKHGSLYSNSLRQMNEAISKHQGYMFAATEHVKHIKGIRQPGFVGLSQWPNVSSVNNYHNEVSKTSKGAAYTRVVAEMVPFCG